MHFSIQMDIFYFLKLYKEKIESSVYISSSDLDAGKSNLTLLGLSPSVTRVSVFGEAN